MGVNADDISFSTGQAISWVQIAKATSLPQEHAQLLFYQIIQQSLAEAAKSSVALNLKIGTLCLQSNFISFKPLTAKKPAQISVQPSKQNITVNAPTTPNMLERKSEL
jgi:hypothetical protein